MTTGATLRARDVGRVAPVPCVDSNAGALPRRKPSPVFFTKSPPVIPDLRLDEFAQMSLEALVAPEVGIASWRADTWTWRPGPARRVGLGFGSARIAADCAHEIGGRLHGTADLVSLDRVDRDPRPLWCFPCQRLHAGGRRVQNEIGAWSGAPRSVLTGGGSSPPRKTTRRGCGMPRRQHDPSLHTGDEHRSRASASADFV